MPTDRQQQLLRVMGATYGLTPLPPAEHVRLLESKVLMLDDQLRAHIGAMERTTMALAASGVERDADAPRPVRTMSRSQICAQDDGESDLHFLQRQARRG